MPYTSCCVSLCVSSTRRTPNLQFHRLPEEGSERRELWFRVIRNDSLTRQTTSSQLARICDLHFADKREVTHGCPSIFPWSKEWADVITKFNAELALTQKADGPRISPLPLLTPETTGVEVPGLKSDEAMSVDGELSESRARVGTSQTKGKKRLRIWVDESDGDEEQVGRNYDESETGNYMMVSDQLASESGEKRVSLPDSVTVTAVAAPKGGEVVTMSVTPNTNKMSVHEKAFFSPYHSSQVLNKLTDLWRLGKMCDATICVGYTIRIKAHKLVLASMSSVIMNMAAKTDGAILELQLPGDLNVDAVQKFITFLYEGVLYLSATTVMDIQRLATIFKVEAVLGYCQTFLMGMPSQSLNQESRAQISPQPSLQSQANISHTYPLVQSVVGPVVPAGVPVPAVCSPSPQPLALQLRPATSSTDTENWPKRPILRQQSTIDEDIHLYGKYTKDSPSMLHSKRIQELKGIWKRSYDTSDERSSPVTGSIDPLISSPLTGDHSSTKGTDSPGGSFDQADLGVVKTEPEDSATESGEESNQTLPGSVQFRDTSSEGMDPPDTPSVSKYRSKTLTTDPLLANNDPALLTQQVRNAMPKTGVLFENLPIPDGFLSESNPEQQRRYMASLLERTQTSAIPENERQYRCLFCPSSFVKAKSCVVHVIETHQVQAKDVLKYVSIERKGSTSKDKLRGKCSMCEYKVNRNYDHLHYHKYFKHGIPLPDGYQLYRCEICGKESSSKYNWRTHMDTCHFQGNTCEMCDQNFNSREELADHYRNFHISKRASPPKKRLKRLTKNVSAPADTSQSRSYVYKCPECSVESNTRDDIVSHMASVHDRSMDVPDLRQTDTGSYGDKDRLQRAQSADTEGQEKFERVKSEDTEDSKEEASFHEETGSTSNHSEYECESPDSSVVQPKEQE